VTYVLERSQIVAAPREEVFRFFEEPQNLAKITPRWLGFRITRADEPPMREGFRIDYQIRWLGLPVRWRTVIREYEAGRRFVDVQVSGPYRRWEHEHTFEDAEGGTLVRDRVQYELPFGILGHVAHRLLVARQLRRIFDHRSRRIKRLFGAK
jgi:ligand-binding SRPBCC domain-containing protein